MTLKSVGELEALPKIKFNYGHFNTHNVQGALNKLLNSPTLPQKSAYWVGRVGKKVQDELKTIGDKYYKMVCEFAEKDSNGIPLKEETTGAAKIVKGKEKDFEKAYNEFVKNDVEFEWEMLPAKDFERAGLTPNELLALEPMLHGLG